jgi:hypothetical protein
VDTLWAAQHSAINSTSWNISEIHVTCSIVSVSVAVTFEGCCEVCEEDAGEAVSGVEPDGSRLGRGLQRRFGDVKRMEDGRIILISRAGCRYLRRR